MKEIINVKENYSIIIANKNEDTEKNDKYIQVREDIFETLIQFIENSEKNNENKDILKFVKIVHIKGKEYGIVLKNYIGTIQIDNKIQIQIIPKISFEKEENINKEKTKRIVNKMLSTFHENKYKEYNMADVQLDNFNLYEVFINMYLKELIKLINNGIKAFYINKIDNILSVKGKILMNKHIVKNIVHKERFYCEYDEYAINTAENRIIKSTLLKLLRISNNNENIRKINQLLIYFDLAKQSTNYDADFSKININRTNRYYKYIIEWSKIFLKDKSFTNFSGENNTRALLFPMEKLFEAYVTKMINLNKPKSYELGTQNLQKFLYDKPTRFGLKPDIIIKENGKIIAILDAKWKNLSVEKPNYGIKREDMYQMYAYAKKYDTKNIWLLYPLNNEMRNHKQIVYETDDNEKIKVNVFFVDLDIDNVKNNINELLNNIKATAKSF